MLPKLLSSVLYSTLLSYFLNNGASVKFRYFKSMNEEDDILFDFTSKYDIFHSEIFDVLNPNATTFMYMHGYFGDVSTAREYCQELGIKYEGDVNCIIVDWTSVAHNANYIQVKNRLQDVSFEVSSFIRRLVTNGHNVNDFVLIGHSLGAHLCGLSAKRLKKSVGKVGTIIGLDPAGPGFSIFDVKNRLDRSDAQYVLVLHTDIRMYGIQRPIGHADVYVNGGKRQPGCLWLPTIDSMNFCSHGRAPVLWIQALTTNFEAYLCSRFLRLTEDYGLLNNKTTIMGPNMTHAHGVFFLETYGEPPFLKPWRWYDYQAGDEVTLE